MTKTIKTTIKTMVVATLAFIGGMVTTGQTEEKNHYIESTYEVTSVTDEGYTAADKTGQVTYFIDYVDVKDGVTLKKGDSVGVVHLDDKVSEDLFLYAYKK